MRIQSATNAFGAHARAGPLVRLFGALTNTWPCGVPSATLAKTSAPLRKNSGLTCWKCGFSRNPQGTAIARAVDVRATCEAADAGTPTDLLGDMADRVLLFKYSYGFIGLPGGLGTLDELFEALTLIQTGKIARPSRLLGEREVPQRGRDCWAPGRSSNGRSYAA